ncbi:MAG: metallophosphoesterase [Myxococcales bacterium]|nr:metallophosphoesterase [Myxococcales bacterium]
MLVLLSACFAPAPTEPPAPAPVADRARVAPVEVVDPAGRRVVAVGDLHGDREASVATLRLAGLIDEQERWIGGETVFVQTGDVTDRGPDSKGVMDLVRSLVEPARAAGGEVVLLNGNHEVMNLQGDWRYVSEGDLADFGSREARKAAFAEGGEYGRWLTQLPVVAKVGSTVFAHGGITDTFAELGVDGLNALARQHYLDTPGPLGHPIHGDAGPTWYRGYAQDSEATACPILERALATLGATRMVVGHTAQRTGEPLVRCGGRFTVIDIGISAAYGYHPGAWELLGDDARMLLSTGPRDLPDPSPVASPAAPE